MTKEESVAANADSKEILSRQGGKIQKIDLLIGYTKSTVIKMITFDNCILHAKRTVKKITDTILPNSGINASIQLVDVVVVDYEEKGKRFQDMLNDSIAGKCIVTKSERFGVPPKNRMVAFENGPDEYLEQGFILLS